MIFKGKIRAFSALLLSAVILPSPAGSNSAEGAYDPNNGKMFESFYEAYGWSTENSKKYSWTGFDGQEYARLTGGYQLDAFDDSLEALVQQLKDQGYELNLSGGRFSQSSGSGGGDIAAAALGEVGQPDCYEMPSGSNNVKYNTWRYGSRVCGDNYAWCANFVCWCADRCGYIESGLFSKSESCVGLFRHFTASGFGVYSAEDTKQLGGGSYPAVPGDIAFWYSGGVYTHVGIVTGTTDTSCSVTQGNVGNPQGVYTYTYTTGSGYAPRFIVHVEYPDCSFDGGETCDTVYLFLTRVLGMSSAGACGVMGNMEAECGWDIQCLGDGGTSYGLCQWHNERWSRLKLFCEGSGYDWRSLEGQCRFLEKELGADAGDYCFDADYSYMMSVLKSTPDTAEGVRSAALLWAQTFERCDSRYVSARPSMAMKYWEKYGRG